MTGPSTRHHGVFFSRPFSCPGRSRPVLAWERQVSQRSGSFKAGPKSIWGAGCGRYCHRVVELLESKTLVSVERILFLGKNGPTQEMPRVHPPKSRCPRYTHPSRTFTPASRNGSYGSNLDDTSARPEPPVVVKKDIKTRLSLGEPSPAAAKRQRVTASSLRSSARWHFFF